MSQQFNRIVSEVDIQLTSLYKKNDEFNEFYDDLVSFSELPDLENMRPSEVLFKCASDLYETVLEDWKIQSFSERFDLTYNLLKSPHSKGRVQDLVSVLKKGKVAPFVGAGLSIPCGKKSWPETLWDLANLSSRINMEELKTLLDEGKYLESADLIENELKTRLPEYIRTTLAAREVNGPICLLPHLSRECVITTNLDNILEKVYLDNNCAFKDGFMHGMQDHDFMRQFLSGGQCLLKMHGDFQNTNTQVFTKTQYDEAYGKEDIDYKKPLPKTLRQIYISHTLLFLGCSLEQDQTLELFKEIADQNEFQIPWHYALIETPKGGNIDEREDMLSSVNIIPIWYPHGEHDYVENFMEFLVAHKSDEGYWP